LHWKDLQNKKFCVENKEEKKKLLKDYKFKALTYKYPKISLSGNEIKGIINRKNKIEKEMFRTVAKKRRRNQSPIDEKFDPSNFRVLIK